MTTFPGLTLPTLPPVELSRWLLGIFQTRVHIHYKEPLPAHEGCLLVVSNHRSFLDAPALIWALRRPVHLVCHHYLAQVPVINELVRQLGGFHLGPGGQGWSRLFAEASGYLRSGSHVAIFPEGAQLITQDSYPNQGAPFRRGFAHLALRSGIADLAVVPVAVVSRREVSGPLVPLWFLSLFDSREPTFKRPGWHPYVLYEQVEIVVGRARRLTDSEVYRYRHGEAAQVTASLTEEMQKAARQLTLDSQGSW